MNSYYTFFVISNINSKHSVFNPDQRFLQTLDTINSIRKKVKNVKIIFCDNSTIPLSDNQNSILSKLVDVNLPYENNLFTKHVNSTGFNKGLNEVLVYEHMLNYAEKNNLNGKRIFKISGRYQLSDQFDIYEYEKIKYYNKYVYTITTWLFNPLRPVGTGEGDITTLFFNTACWSMCSTLVSNYREILDKIFINMMVKNKNIEVSHYELIPKDKSIEVDKIHGYGLITDGNSIHF